MKDAYDGMVDEYIEKVTVVADPLNCESDAKRLYPLLKINFENIINHKFDDWEDFIKLIMKGSKVMEECRFVGG